VYRHSLVRLNASMIKQKKIYMSILPPLRMDCPIAFKLRSPARYPPEDVVQKKDKGNIKKLRSNRRKPPYPPSLSSVFLNSAGLLLAFLSSHSEDSLVAPSPSSATAGPVVLPTSVVARKPRTA